MAFRGLASSLKAFAFRAPIFLSMPAIYADYDYHDTSGHLAETKKEARQFLIWYNKTLRASHIWEDDQSLDVIAPPFFQEVNYPVEVSGIEPD